MVLGSAGVSQFLRDRDQLQIEQQSLVASEDKGTSKDVRDGLQ